MSALAFAVLTLAALTLADHADSAVGRACFEIVAVGLLACGLLVAPFGEVLE